MMKNRLEAFSDGVLAIIITIMVLELRPPENTDLQSLLAVVPFFLSYLVSFIYIAIYWNNHHHLFITVERINGKILWANFHFLFWMSLIPFTTAWIGKPLSSHLPVLAYGVILLFCNISYLILQLNIISFQGDNSILKKAIGKDVKGKVLVLFYIIGIVFSFYFVWISLLCYILVAIIWFIPDKRIEKILH